ncbi:uracil-DNA glycosylase [Candidatus Xenohaliotis californiensis]|uniref:Uracil-DNA glycosylase n=1 Tax=Candidatus Xenohaliotis californiensis TaxID=84677 RepID=A0ABP0EX14_9RICK|nr:uracil-DNA glycosylase [Candidatus Xenohaliotis californiensis]
MIHQCKKDQEIYRFHIEIGLDYLSCIFPVTGTTKLVSNNLCYKHNITAKMQDKEICKQIDTRMQNKKLLDEFAKIKDLLSLQEFANDFDHFPFANAAKKLVFGAGKPNGLMIVGDMPSIYDEQSGQPFSDVDINKLLTDMLKAIHIEIKNCYITNILLHRYNRIDNRGLLSKIATYKEFLIKHIALVQPKAILLMGKLPVSSIFNINSIINARKQHLFYDNNGYQIPVVATYHPEMLLKGIESKKFAWNDLQILRNKIIKLNVL